MGTISDLKKDFGVRLVPVQWRTMLENGIEVDVLNDNLFDLSVLDLCKGRGGNDPKSFIFSFKVGDEEIAFGVKQRTEIVEKIVDGHVCTEIVPVPLNDHFIEIIDSKNGTLRTYSLELIEEIVPEELKEINDDRETYISGHINIKEYNVDVVDKEPEYVDPFSLEY